MLEVQKYLENHSFFELRTNYGILVKEYENKRILKYSQINSPLSEEIVQECRGLILDKNNNVISRSFDKFFNLQEEYSDSLNLKNSYVLEKLDGSLINLYFYENKWNIATTGKADAEGEVKDDYQNKFSSFNDLARYTINKSSHSFWNYIKNYPNVTFMFELTTPHNTVVKKHEDFKITLLGARNNKTGAEYNRKFLKNISEGLGVDLVKAYYFEELSYDSLEMNFINMPYSEEGYVIVEESYKKNGSFKRVKLKNPSYVAAHHLKHESEGWRIVEIIKSNEIDEFVSYFPSKEKELLELKNKYERLKNILETHAKELFNSKEYDNWGICFDDSELLTEKRKQLAKKIKEIAKENKYIQSFLFHFLDYGSRYFCLSTELENWLRNTRGKLLYRILKTM